MIFRLLEAIEKLGYKKHGRATKIAELIGYSVSQVSDILSGKHPMNEKFEKLICNELKINRVWLETGEGEMFRQPQHVTYESTGNIAVSGESVTTVIHRPEEAFDVSGRNRLIPIISWAQAGAEGFYEDSYSVGHGIGNVYYFDDFKDENMYALLVKGDSMTPKYESGEIIIVSPNAVAINNDYVVAKFKDGQVMVKRLKSKNSHYILSSTNPEYEDIICEKEKIVFIHKIVGTRG